MCCLSLKNLKIQTGNSTSWSTAMSLQAIKIKLICVLILCILNERYLSSSYAQANAVAQQQQISANSSSSSSGNGLPALSERANGLNSRYLSAGSTASLAAATVAAANQTPQQQLNSNQNQNQNQQGALSHQVQAASQHQHQSLQHQQQQQHQISNNQLQATPSGNPGVQATHSQASTQSGQTQQPNPVSNGLNGSPVASQYSTAPIQPQSAVQSGPSVFSSSSSNNNNNGVGGVSSSVAPVMSSTYAYNPLNGQYEPADLSSVVPNSFALGQQQPQQQQQIVPILNQLPFSITGQGNNNNYPSQLSQPSYQFGNGLQQQQPQQQSFLTNQNNLVNSRSPQRFASSSGQTYYPTYGVASTGQQFLQNPAAHFFQQSSGPFGSRLPQQSFTRRNGQQASGGTRNQANYLAGLDDDSNGLFQQQQVSSVASLADQLAASLGLNLDPSYIGSTGPAYQQPQQHSLDSHHGFVSQSASGQQFGGLTPLPSSLNNHNNNNNNNYNYNSAGVDGHKSEQCVAADGRHGTCYQASECIRRGGTPMGRCGSSGSSSGSSASGTGGTGSGQSSLLASNGGGGGYNLNDLSGSSHVCCLFDVTCGQFAAERFVYFRNPGYPNTFDQSRMCRAKIGKLDKGVCEFRLDLLRFDIAKPTNGNCSHDMFVVSGQNENYVLPKICGLNDGQHYYIGVDESGVITLHMMMMGYYRRSFEILVTQIPCRSDFAAPAHCLQYYMGTHGTIKSFNYDDEIYSIAPGSGGTGGSFVNYELQQDGSSAAAAALGSSNGIGLASAPYGLQFASGNNNGNLNQLQQRQLYQQQQFVSSPVQSGRYQVGGGDSLFGGYPNDLDYTICIRKESGFCSITYQLSRSEQGLAPFAVGQSPFAGQNDTINAGGQFGLGASSVSTECRDDYLLIGGVRLCSGNQFGAGGQSFYDPQIGGQFVQNNNSIYGLGGAAGASIAVQQQQLQNQQAQLMQQLNRLQQQQQQQFALMAGNVSSPGLNSNGNQQQQSGNSNGINNLEQQQAAIVQQLMMVQQQLSSLTDGANYLGQQQGQLNGKRYQQGDGQHLDLQGAIITDTTSGPFLLRFVSNMARNARGFHIDYRQNPCK